MSKIPPLKSFTPKKFLAATVAFEVLSRTALLLALAQIPKLAIETFENNIFVLPQIWFLITAIILYAIFHFLSQRFSLKLGSKAKEKMRAFFQESFLNTPLIQDRDLRGMPFQELSMHYMKTAEICEQWHSRFLPSAILAFLVPLIILIITSFIDIITAAIMLFTGILLPLFLFLIGKIAKKKSESQWLAFSKLRSFFLESLQGFKTIKIFRKIAERERDLKIAETEFGKKTLGVLKTAFLSALVQEWTASLSIALVAVSLALRLMNGSIIFSAAFLALLLTPEFYRPIRQFGVAFHTAINAKTAWNNAEEISPSQLPNAWQSPLNNYKLSLINSQLTLQTPTETISISPHNPLYIAGESGVGKTSLISEFLLNAPANDSIAYLPQIPTWFKGTLRKNLCPVKKIELEEIVSALEAVNLGHFASRLDEQVKEYAGNFSGGEKRRLAIARIILLNRPIWILDEPFAGLDEANIHLIENLIQKESDRRSILCVSHNQGTLNRAKKFHIIAC